MLATITTFIAEKLHTGISAKSIIIKYTKGPKITSLCGHKQTTVINKS